MFFDATAVHPYGSFWLDVADKIIKALAVIVGAVWTLWNFQQSRTYKPKPACSVVGKLFRQDGQTYIDVLCTIKNTGQTKYTIFQKGTYLSATVLKPSGREEIEGNEVFLNHHWIEPGEQIDEPLILRVPEFADLVALKLDLRVVSEGIEWNASTIVRSSDSAISGGRNGERSSK